MTRKRIVGFLIAVLAVLPLLVGDNPIGFVVSAMPPRRDNDAVSAPIEPAATKLIPKVTRTPRPTATIVLPTSTATPEPTATASATLEPTVTMTPSVVVPPGFSLYDYIDAWTPAQETVMYSIFWSIHGDYENGYLPDYHYLTPKGRDGVSDAERLWAICAFYDKSPEVQKILKLIRLSYWRNGDYTGPIPPGYSDIQDFFGVDCEIVLAYVELKGGKFY
jgi:hypothetical protein